MSVPTGKWPINCVNINIFLHGLGAFRLVLVAFRILQAFPPKKKKIIIKKGVTKSLTAAIKILNLAHKSLVLRDMAKRSWSAPSWRATYVLACQHIQGAAGSAKSKHH